MNRVMIAVPARGTVSAKFMTSLLAMARHTKLDFSLNVRTGSSVLGGREALLREAVSGGYSHILWLDSDMSFPEDLMDRLMAHNSPVAACAYANAYSLEPNVFWSQSGDEVEWMSLGCSLINLSVVRSISTPFFSMEYDHITGTHSSEWYTFCRKLKSIGVPILIDWELSKNVFHEVLFSAPLGV